MDAAQYGLGEPGRWPRVRWLGHATTVIEDSGARVLTDPLLTRRVAHLRRRRGDIPDHSDRIVDVVLLSHLHADHTHLPSLRSLADDIPIIAPRNAPDSVPALRSVGGRLIEVVVGDEVAIGGVVIRVIPAQHDGRRWRRGPHTTAALGYVVVGAARTWFAGDTDLYPEMSEWAGEVDLSLLPVGGWGPTLGDGHMDPERAVRAAEAVGSRHSIPIHFGTMWPIGFGAVRPSLFTDPGADFVRIATEHRLAATELAPGDWWPEAPGDGRLAP